MAIARKINAEAFAKEIENSIAYVDAYFRRQEINREERAKKNPNYLEQEKRRQEVLERRFKEQFQDVLEGGDLASKLNWLLVELSGPAESLGYLASDAAVNASDESHALSEADVALIRFGDGHVTFSAVDPEILETRWPFALRAERFRVPREDFVSAREAILKEIQSEGEAGHESANRLIGALDGLMVGLDKAYPPEERVKLAVFPEYHSAKRYLGSLAREVNQTIRNGDPSLFDETLRFEGKTIVELIWHMDRRGLVFAPPSAAGERVYRSLLSSMRDLYLAHGG
jgi:hypothetical protein